MTQDQLFWLLVTGIIGVVVVLTWLIYWVYRASVLSREERRLMIERGMSPPEPPATSWPAVKAREQQLRFEERRLLIEKGLDPDRVGQQSATGSPEYYLRRGLASLFIGLGAAGAYVMLRLNLELATSDTRDWLLALSIASPVVTLYGAACLLFYRATKDRARETTPAG